MVKKDVKTESYPMSIGEIVSMYDRDEIILRPQYQRYFRWTHEQKSKLIESLLIGLPLPSFFVSQTTDGEWEVVDGMQRLSTILDFIGKLKDENKKQEGYERFEKLISDLFYLNQFDGKTWSDFPKRVQLDFKRTKIQLTILMRETSDDSKFELFQRLNSGGTSISGQELRNAILAGEDINFLEFLESLSTNHHFKDVTDLSKNNIATRFDLELVLRFIIFVNDKYVNDLGRHNSVDVFLTHVMREIIKDKNNFSYDEVKKTFNETFKKISDVSGHGALRYKTEPGTGKFSIGFFEAVALGIARNIGTLPSDDELDEKIRNIADTEVYKKNTGSGKNAKIRIPALVNLGKEHFSSEANKNNAE